MRSLSARLSRIEGALPAAPHATSASAGRSRGCDVVLAWLRGECPWGTLAAGFTEADLGDARLTAGALLSVGKDLIQAGAAPAEDAEWLAACAAELHAAG